MTQIFNTWSVNNPVLVKHSLNPALRPAKLSKTPPGRKIGKKR